MSLFQQMEKWSSTHNPKWLALLRVALGFFLFIRGISFLNNQDKFEEIISNSSLHAFSGALAHIIPWVHIIGGFFIIIGIMTRICCFIQLPILLGAVIFVSFPKEIFDFQSDFGYTIILLILLVVFFIEGNGPLSLINYLKND